MKKKIAFAALALILTALSPAHGDLYYPHFASNAYWETEIGLINGSDGGSVSGTLDLHEDSGALIDQIDVTLPPRGKRVFWGADLVRDYAGGKTIGYLVFSTTSDNAVGYLKFQDPLKYSVAIPASQSPARGEIFIPHIASTDTWATGVSVVNTTDAAIDMCFEFDTGITKTKSVAAGRHEVFFMRALFDDTPQPRISAAKIRGAEGIVGLILFSNGRVLDGIPLDDQVALQVYYPHLVMTGGWNTGIVAYNTSYQDSTITVSPFTTGGTARPPVDLLLKRGERISRLASTLPLGITDGWAKITATRPLSGFELFAHSRQLAGYMGPREGAMTGILPKIETGSAATGVVFVNDNAESTSVNVDACDDGGDVIDSTVINLGPRQKWVAFVFPVGEPLASMNYLFSTKPEGATYLAYASEDKVVAFQMNASTNGQTLDSIRSLNPAPAPAVLTSIEIVPDVLALKIHETASLGAFGWYSDGTCREITDQVAWTSSNSGTASVENSICQAGLVKGKEVGAATVTADIGEISATAAVSVDPSAYVASDYFPLVLGSWWTYEKESGEETRTDISGTRPVSEATTLVYQYDTGTKQYFTSDADGIKFHGMYYVLTPSEGAPLTLPDVLFDAPFLYIPGNIQVGQVYEDTTTATIRVSSGIFSMDIPLSIEIKTTIVGIEDVTSRDSLYRNVIRISQDIKIKSKNSFFISYVGSDTYALPPLYYWLGEGTGVVKLDLNGEAETIIDYDIPEVP